MKRIIFVLLLFFGFAALAQDGLVARYDRRTELVSIVYRLADRQEYSQCYFAQYASDVDRHFASFKNHAAVLMAQKMADRVTYDAPMAFAHRLLWNDTIALNSNLADDNDYYYLRWNRQEEQTFVMLLNQFAKESHFDEFYQAHRDLYSQAEQALQALLNVVDMDWFDSYFEPRDNVRYTATPSLLNGPENYSYTAHTLDGGSHLSLTLGCCFPDKNGTPAFNANTQLPIIIHEVCHSYCNPLDNQHWKSLSRPAGKVYLAYQQQMERQAYPSPFIMMNETFVRACVIRYFELHFNQYQPDGPLMDEVGYGFVLTPTVLECLRRRDMNKFPTMNAYMPTLCKEVRSFSLKRFLQEQAEMDRQRPHVLDCQMPTEAGEGRIVIVFDKPMGDKVAVYNGNTGDPFPTLSSRQPPVEWSPDHTTLTIYVNLESGKSYAFGVEKGFRSADGRPLSEAKYYSFKVNSEL